MQTDPPGHSPPGFDPAGVKVQRPGAPPALQVSQVPSQAVSQQTPSAQWPLAHWLPAAQANPSGSFPTHDPPSQ